MTRPPIPDWTREGETWRVEEERHLCIANDDDEGTVCRGLGGRCGGLAVATGRKNYRLAFCEKHLRISVGAWVEDGRVVSWCLRP